MLRNFRFKEILKKELKIENASQWRKSYMDNISISNVVSKVKAFKNLDN